MSGLQKDKRAEPGNNLICGQTGHDVLPFLRSVRTVA